MLKAVVSLNRRGGGLYIILTDSQRQQLLVLIGDIRLSPDGPSQREGRVEVCYRGVWGAVSDGEWSSRDAAVACRQLGFPSQG